MTSRKLSLSTAGVDVGTFHTGLGELHGITVVVDTHDTRIVAGRCHEVTAKKVILHDADLHDVSSGDLSKEQYVERAARVGFWPKHKRLALDLEDVASIRRLGEITVEESGATG